MAGKKKSQKSDSVELFAGEEDVFNLQSVNESFNMDQLDNWSTTIGLVQSVIALIEKRIPSCNVHLFYHSVEYHEYREIDREGITSFSDDSIFIGCLSMVTDIIPLEKMFSEFQIEDPMVSEVLRSLYHGRYLLPIVHGFEMVAYLLISAAKPEDEEILNESDMEFLRRLSDRLQINLYAASIAARRQRELLKIAQYPFVLQKHEKLEDVNESLFEDLKEQISFDKGVAYHYDEVAQILFPFAFYKIKREEVPTLKVGEGISGQVFQSWMSVFIPDRKTHPAYSIMDAEPFIDGSFISVPLGTSQKKLGVITVSRKQSNKESFSIEHQYMLEIASAFFASETINRDLNEELKRSNLSFVDSLTNALEAKDKYTEGHSARVSTYSVEIGKKLGYSKSKLHILKYGAQLHDIGKIGIADAIINKPDRLTEEERKIIENHTEIGYKILSVNPFFDSVKNFVRYHHESMDGSGYYHLKGGEYPEEAMIISCADIYDALTSDRPYRKALSRKQALQILATNIGTHFTQKIYDAFADYLEHDAPIEA